MRKSKKVKIFPILGDKKRSNFASSDAGFNFWRKITRFYIRFSGFIDVRVYCIVQYVELFMSRLLEKNFPTLQTTGLQITIYSYGSILKANSSW